MGLRVSYVRLEDCFGLSMAFRWTGSRRPFELAELQGEESAKRVAE